MPRVLAIQSHVVRGHVGNMSAVFPLQLNGIDVDPLNTVQVSNHSGYPIIKGHRFDADHFAGLFEALAANGHDEEYDMILTGYMGNPLGVPAVAKGIAELKKKNSKAAYLMDPVLGDNGKLYLPPEMIEHYRTSFLPIADIITPNQFEAELLADMKINSASDGLACARALANHGPSFVVITTLDTPETADANHLALLVYSAKDDAAWTVRFPRLPAHFTGTGDLFSSLITCQFVTHLAADKSAPHGRQFADLVSSAVWVMQRVLIETDQYAIAVIKPNDEKAAILRKRELRLVHCKREIERLLNIDQSEVSASGIKVLPVE